MMIVRPAQALYIELGRGALIGRRLSTAPVRVRRVAGVCRARGGAHGALHFFLFNAVNVGVDAWETVAETFSHELLTR